MRLLLAFALTGALLAGCSSQQRFTQYESAIAEQSMLVDSLHRQNRYWQTRYAAAIDTLTFYEDIDTGRYYREIRSFEDRINRLEYDLSVSRDGGLTVATLQTDDLFEPASATLAPRAAEPLAELATRLKDKHPGASVRIEGHSDSVPVGPTLQDRYPSNWELSAARAAAVARYLVAEHGLDENLLSVVSFGAVHPVASNATAAGRSENRRLRIAVLPEVRENVAAE